MFEEIFSQNPLGIIIWNKEGKITYANPSFLQSLDLKNIPLYQEEICKQAETEKEIEILKVLDNMSKPYKTYTKEFILAPGRTVKLDVMTSRITFSNQEFYFSQTRFHKVKNDFMKTQILKKQNEVLLKLTKSETIDSGDLEASVREITEAATEALGCERSSVWFYKEDNTSILSMDLYQKTLTAHSSGVELFAKDFPAYFKYLSEERVLGANNAHTDPNTFEFSAVYLTPLNIKSMLDAPIRLHGKMVGVICNESVGEYLNWTAEELNFSASLADLISRAIEAKIRKQAEDEIKQINENLELKVQEQTREIRESLQQITKLKEFQDGDYFLTSLILNPLIGNKNTSEKILTEFIVKQKKQFQFRKSSGQIGGDFCITETISFRSPEDKYVFFLNADAMGKSMQGASGAIVLGTAILNILWQAKNKTDMSKLTPSDWLEYAIIELNNIFMTFDGSMLISGFFGLVGENSRDLLYSNFEHPHAVILRDNSANFLDTKNQNSKLGVQSLSSIYIENTFLYPQDILLIGSDGKDDIEISSNDSGRSINEDENLILNLIEESKGNLQKLETLINEKGEFIDDLSLMKITIV